MRDPSRCNVRVMDETRSSVIDRVVGLVRVRGGNFSVMTIGSDLEVRTLIMLTSLIRFKFKFRVGLGLGLSLDLGFRFRFRFRLGLRLDKGWR